MAAALDAFHADAARTRLASLLRRLAVAADHEVLMARVLLKRDIVGDGDNMLLVLVLLVGGCQRGSGQEKREELHCLYTRRQKERMRL